MNTRGVHSVGLVLALIAGLLIAAPAHATHSGANDPAIDIDDVDLVPDSASLPAGGTCVQFTVTGTQGGATAEGETIDVQARFSDNDNGSATNDEISDLTLEFCDPDGSGPGTGLGLVSDRDDDGGTESAASVRAECTSNAQGECVFGVSVLDEQVSSSSGGTGSLTAWADLDGDNTPDLSEPQDTSTLTIGACSCFVISCAPPSQTKTEGGRVEFQCTATNAAGQPLAGVIITMDVLSGPNADEAPVVTCTTDAQGRTPGSNENATPAAPTPGACGYNDAGTASSPPGTDNVAFCSQAGARPGQPSTSGCDEHELQSQGDATATVTWVVRADNIACTPDGGLGSPGTAVTVECSVHDEMAHPVIGSSIVFNESGPGVLSASSCITGSDGSCFVTSHASADELGTQMIEATLTSGACDATGQPVPGSDSNCSDTASIEWSSTPPQHHCSDGGDNDGDGEIDLDDRGCESASDGSEAGPFSQDVFMRYRRRFRRGFTGQVDSTFARCQRGRLVKIHRIGVGVVRRDRTNRDGNFFVPFPPRRGRYQARVPATTVTLRNGQTVECLPNRSAVIRTRRR